MKTYNVYLAARYSRREELCRYRAGLELLGHTVTSHWLNGSHQISDGGTPIDETGEALIKGTSGEVARLREEFAVEDVADIGIADVVISFTEPPRSGHNRGGRHVEFGLAIALGKRLIVVGHRENLFHSLPHVEFCETWTDAVALLSPKEQDA